MAGSRNTISVTLQSSQELTGSNASVVNIFNLTGLSGLSPVELDAVIGGDSGHLLFCSDGVSAGSAQLVADSLQLSLCANRTLLANTLYAFSFSITNPTTEQGAPAVQISANGTAVIAPSSMDSSSATAAGIAGAAAPLFIVQPRILLKRMAQTRPLVSVVNTLVLTLATNVELAGADGWAMTISGLEGTAQPGGPIGVAAAAGGVPASVFCDGAQPGLGAWSADALTLQWCAGATWAAQAEYVISVNVTNGNQAQAAPAISVQLSGLVNLTEVAVDTPGTALIGIPLGSDPLVLAVPLFEMATISQSNPAAGSSNELSLAFRMNVDLLPEDASQIVLSGLGAVSSPPTVFLQDVAGGNNADQRFCTGGVVSAGVWDDILETVTLALCPGLALRAGVDYALAFALTNPSAAQGAATIAISSTGTADVGPSAMSSPRYAVLGIEDGSLPLLVIVPEFDVRAMAQSTPLPGLVNTISVTIRPNIDMLSTDISRITFSGLPVRNTNNVILNLQFSGGNSTGLFSPLPPPSITVDAAAWDSSNGILILFLYRNQMLAAGVAYSFSLDFQNPSGARASPDIYISAQGTAEFAPALVTKPNAPLLGVANAQNPFVTYVPLLTVKQIGQSTPEFFALNTMTVTLQSNVDLYGADGSAITLTGFLNAIVGSTNVSLGGGASSVRLFCNGGAAGQALWDGAAESVTLALCPGESMLAGQTLELSFNITNPHQPQAAPGIAFQVSGTAAISGEMDAPGLATSVLEVPGGADPMEVVIILFWNQLNVTEGPSKGGTLVPISGLHFQQGGGAFSCLFENGDDPVGIEVSATILSNSELACTTPAWPLRGANARLRLKYEGIRLPFNTFSAINFNGTLYLHSEPAPAVFLLYDGWDGLAPSSVTRGSAAGGDVIAVDGYGFDWREVYRCVFERGAQRMATVATVRSLTELTCQAAPWGLEYAAGEAEVEGEVRVAVERGGAALRYTDGGIEPVPPGLCTREGYPGRCSFVYFPEWTADGSSQSLRLAPSTPTEFSAAGGEVLLVSGVGFSANLSYVCRFQYRFGAAISYEATSPSSEVANSTLLRCTTPVWEFTAVTTAMLTVLVNTSSNGSASVYEVPLANAEAPLLVAFEEFYTSVSPSQGLAIGGETVTLRGLGFDASKRYSVFFVDGRGNVPAAFASLTELEVQTPAVAGESRNISIFLRYNGSEPLRLAPGWPGDPGTSDALPFTLLSVLTGVSPAFVSRVPGAGGALPQVEVQGLAFQQYANYTCRLSSGNSSGITQATALDTTTVVCDVNVLAFQEPWDVEVFATLEVLADGAPVAAAGSTEVELVHVNAQPSFTVNKKWIYWMASMGAFSSADQLSWGPYWAVNRDPGGALEAGQEYTFHVTYAPTSLLQGAPTVDVNGTLEFVPTAGVSGVVTVSVVMQDNGGTRFGGVDTSAAQTLFINLEEEATAPNFLASRTTVTVQEDAEACTLPFLTILDENDAQVLESYTVQIAPDSELDDGYFDQVPVITSQGMLEFRAKANAFGVAYYNMTVLFENAATGTTLAASRNVTIVIESVNDLPSFNLDVAAQTFTELELLSDSEHIVGHVASMVFAGDPFALTGPRGEDWGELTQNLSFAVYILGDGSFLQSTPSLDIFTSGENRTYTAVANLTFTPIPHTSGVERLGLVLVDSDGLNTSSLQRVLELTVLPVNDEPAFALNCSKSEAVNCSQNCSVLGLEGCAVEVRVDENCDLCQADAPTGCVAGFSVAGLFHADASLYGSPDEQAQNLSFSLEMVAGDEVFARGGMPAVAVEDGTLRFCLGEDLNGNVTFNVTLYDDGGWARGGTNVSKTATLTIFVHPVNQQPSFAVNASAEYLWFWMNSGNHSVSAYAVDILRGRADVNGSDRELFQDISFLVRENEPALFQRAPQIDRHGELMFSPTDDQAGLVNLTLTLVDDGGTYGLGVNLSDPQFGVFAIVDAFVLLEVGIFDSCLLPGWESLLEAQLALDFGVDRKWVDVVPQGLYRPFVSFFDPEGVDPSLQLRNGSRAATIRVVGISNATAFDYLQRWPSIGGMLPSDVPSNCAGQEWIYLRTANAFLVQNLRNEPTFLEASASVVWPEETVNTTRTYPDFVYAIVSPKDVPYDGNGTEQVIFDIRPVGHKLFRRTTWTMDGSDGGLVIEQPTLTAVCTPVCQNATLRFAHRALWNGEVIYEATMRSTNVSANFTITVLPVNQHPSFQLYTPVVFLEPPSFRSEAAVYNRTQYAIVEQQGNVSIDDFAFMISPGPNVEDEQNQTLYFAVELVGSSGSVEVTMPPRIVIADSAMPPDMSFLNEVASLNGTTNATGNATTHVTEIFTMDLPSLSSGNVVARLAVGILQHTSGTLNFTATLVDSGVPAPENFTVPFQVIVEPVNDEPAFAVNCSASDAVSCNQNCSALGGPDCSVEIRVDENCDFCPEDWSTGCAAGFSVPGLFLYDASLYGSPDEQGQNLTFVVEMVGGDALFDAGMTPRVLVSEQGTATFCLGEDRNGAATFNITLRDDGGVARGGIDASAVGSLSVIVHPVNQKPSFNVSFGSYLWFWMNSGNNTLEEFAVDILRGNRDADGSDREHMQNVTFVETNAEHTLFASVPRVSSTGTLSLEVQPETTGVANFSVALVDDGGTYGTGENTSDVETVAVSVVESYVLLFLTVDDAAVDWTGEEGQERLVAVIARELGVHPNWVIFESPPHAGQRQLQSAVRLTVRVLALTSEQALDYAARLRDLGLAADAAFAAAGLSRIAVETFRRNFGAEPRFRINSSAWSWPEQEADSVLVVPGFVEDMFAPQDVPLDSQGRERVFLSVRVVGHRLFRRAEWTLDGTDGGLMTQAPSLTAVCAPLCKNATLEFGHAALYNGEVMYEASMLTTNFTLNFTISVLPVDQQPSFAMQPVLFVLAEPSPTVSVEGNVTWDNATNCTGANATNCTTGNSSVTQPVSVVVVESLAPGFVTGIVTGPQIEDEQQQLVSFAVEPVGRSGINGSIFPENATASARSGTLALQLLDPQEGRYVFNVTMQDDGTSANGGVDLAIEQTFVVESVRVNSSIRVLENECSLHACHILSFASDISELTYLGIPVTFEVSVIEGDVVVEPQLARNGTLSFKTLPMRIGNSTLTVVLRANGAIQWSLLYREVLIEVLFVNQPPSFDLTTTVVAGEPAMPLTLQLAENISQGPQAVPPEVEQQLTFSVELQALDSRALEAACDVSFCLALATAPLFASEPAVDPEGVLTLRVADNGFGAAQYNISLADDGGTARGGDNESAVQQVCVVVPPTDRLVPFAISEERIFASEAVGGNQVVTMPGFAAILDESIRDKGVHFVVAAVEEVVPNLPTDSFAPATADLFLDDTATQLFANGSQLSLDLNGTLSFELAEQRNGKVRFSVVLSDDRGLSCSDAVTFRLEVLPVNQPPTMALQPTLWLAETDVDTHFSEQVVAQLSRGGWAEETQRFAFSFEITSGSDTLLLDAAFTLVGQVNATLDFTLPANRYGNVSMDVTLKDSGGFERGGNDTARGTLTVYILPVNDVPSFRLTTTNIVINRNTGSACRARLTGVPWVSWTGSGSACSADFLALGASDQVASAAQCTPYPAARLNEHVGVVADVSLGPFEEASFPGCDALCPSGGYPQCGCELQQANFTVEPVEPAAANRLFEGLPQLLLPCAVLTFTPRVNEIGSQMFRIALADSNVLERGAEKATQWQMFNITVVGINIMPHFDLAAPGITVLEDATAISEQIAVNISADGEGGLYEPDQTFTFSVGVVASSGDLFADGGAPSMTSDGVITFTTRQDAFGNATLLIRIKDDGGTERGGVNVMQRNLEVLVLGVNNPPTYTFQQIVTVPQSSGVNVVASFVRDVAPGPPNEALQALTFNVLSVTNQDLFMTLPTIAVEGSTGTLRFELVDGQSGVSEITFNLQDNNGTERGGIDTSASTTFSLVVDPVNSPPAFGLPWTVTCDLKRIFDDGLCTCPLYDQELVQNPVVPPASVCSLQVPANTKASSAQPGAVVTVLEDAGEVRVEGFALHVTPEEGKVPASLAHFEMDYHLNELTFTALIEDDALSAEGMEYAYAVAPSSDFGRLLYVAERDSNTLAVFCYNATWQAECAAQAKATPLPGSEPGNVSAVLYTRIAEGLFRSEYDAVSPPVSLGGAVCDLARFELAGELYVAAAAGCWPVDANQTVLGPLALPSSKVYRVDRSTHAMVEVAAFPGDAASVEQVSGVASMLAFSRGSTQLLVVAKSVGSSGSLDVASGIYQLDDAGSATLLQQVAGFGAREWVHVQVAGADYLALANRNGPSYLYPMTASGTVRENQRVQLLAGRATGIKAIHAGSETYVVMSVFSEPPEDVLRNATNATTNVTYTVTHPGPEYPCVLIRLQAVGGQVVPTVVQNLTSAQAAGVQAWEAHGQWFVALAVKSNRSSLVFSASPARPLSFTQLQALDTAMASSVERFAIDDVDYLAVSQPASTLIFRWDGARFRVQPSAANAPRDLAGGSVIGAGSVSAVHLAGESNSSLTGLPPGRSAPGSILLGTADGVVKVAGSFEDPISGLNGPSGVAVVPVDGGDLVVVTSKFSAGVSSFMLDADGELRQHGSADCALQGEAAGGTWSSVAVSADRRYVFAVSHSSSAVAAFAVDAATGALDCRAFLQDGEVQGTLVVDGLAGAHGLTVSEDGQRVYVAGWRDAAVAAFEWDEGGGACLASLCYVDRLKSGERDMRTIKAMLNQSDLADFEFQGVEFPARLGGNREPWSFSTTDAEEFEFEGLSMLVAATRTLVVVSVWEPRNSSYRIVQEITHDAAPSAVKAFVIPDRESEDWLYLAVGSSLASGQSGASVPPSLRVFRWNPEALRFVLHHEVSLRLRDGSAFEAGTGKRLPSGVTVAKLEYGKVGDGHFLAAACAEAVGYNATETGPVEARHSYLFRWNPFGSTVLEDGSVGLGAGFATFQVLKERGAVDVKLLPAIQVVVVVARAGASGTDMQVSVARFDRSLFNVDTGSVEGRFDELHTLATTAGASLAAMQLSGVGQLLAVGSAAGGSAAVQFFVWDAAAAQFGAQPSMFDDACGAASASALHFFESGGEVYLVGTEQGGMSGVLQWNRVRGVFGRMLAITDAENMAVRFEAVPDAEIEVHSQCLWFDAGEPRDWEFLVVGATPLLVSSGTTRGTVMVEFDFETVAGLRGAAALAVQGYPSGEGEAIWVAGGVDRAFVALNRTCTGAEEAGCLGLREVFAEAPLRVSRVRSSRGAERVQGLASPRAVRKACGLKFCEDLVCGEVCNASVVGGLDRGELACGPFPPAPISDGGPGPSPPACQDVTFVLELDGTNNPNLFADGPAITPEGALVFTLPEKEFGAAEFQVSLLDSGGARSAPQPLRVEVGAVNHAPTYEVVPEVNGGRDQAVQSLVFARFVSPGAVNEHEQNVSFIITNELALAPTPRNLLLSTPNLTVVSLGRNARGVEEWEGRVEWESPPGVTGSVTIEFLLVDDGPVDAARGDVSISEPGSFELLVRSNNAPPVFSFARGIIQIPEDAGLQVFPNFAVNIGPGYPGENDQVLEFVLSDVVSLDTVFDPDQLFTLFNISAEDGTLMFDTRANFNGEYQVFVQLADDGGTEFFGTNISEPQNFTLIIRANSTMPTWAVLQRHIELLESREFAASVIEGVVGNLSALPEDERDQVLVFVVVENNATYLFADGPDFDLNGTMRFTQQPHRSGTALLGVRLQKSNGERGEVQSLVVSVGQVNDAPSFELRDQVSAVESAGPEALLDVAHDVIAGPPDEAWQALTFTVMYNSSVSGLFSRPPSMDPDGTLRFTAADGLHGEAVLRVSAVDDGGTDLGGVNVSVTKYCRLKIFPNPRVFSVTPRLSSVAGGGRVTIAGVFFGSEYSRGFRAEAYGDIEVTVGGEACRGVLFVSDVAVECELPEGLGRGEVVVEVQDGVVSRRGTLAGGVLYSELYLGGILQVEAGSGALATSPSDGGGGGTMRVEMRASKAVSSMLAVGDEVVVGGNFLSVGEQRVNYVAAWDGDAVRALGRGVDGNVRGLARWGDKVVVVGAFTRAVQESGAHVATGGVAVWDGDAWGDLGCSVSGSVAAVAVEEGRVFVGGAMTEVCGVRCGNVAMWDAQLGWRAVGEGVAGGSVGALVVQGTNVYVGGSFVQVAGRAAGRVARWDGRVWHTMGSLEGTVHALATFGEYVFAGGEFVTAGGRPASHVARFYSGEWVAVGGGVNGPVFALQALNGCIWLGGAFTAARQSSEGSELAARYAVRWCVAAQAFEAVNATAGAALGPIRAIEPALHTVYASACPVQGACSSVGPGEMGT